MGAAYGAHGHVPDPRDSRDRPKGTRPCAPTGASPNAPRRVAYLLCRSGHANAIGRAPRPGYRGRVSLARWKRYADWAKHKPLTLRLADRLGRSRGRLAVLNHVNPPGRAPRKPDLAGGEGHELAAAWPRDATITIPLRGLTGPADPGL